MTNNERIVTEKKVRGMLLNAAIQAASCVFFLGMGIKNSLLHERDLHSGDLTDFLAFGVSAMNIGVAVYLCGKVWMLIAGLVPDNKQP